MLRRLTPARGDVASGWLRYDEDEGRDSTMRVLNRVAVWLGFMAGCDVG
jgi:hypothetical protein